MENSIELQAQKDWQRRKQQLRISVLWQISKLRKYPFLEAQLKGASVEELTLPQLILLAWDIEEILRERNPSVVD